MFKKILIANRGEIACRIIATARRMGIVVVAVYSEADKDALHVEMADEAVPIGPAPAAQSYLVIEKIIAACRATGAQAVHPGYGFLSEQGEFARALEAIDIAFIGPSAKAIAAMGDKLIAKEIARSSGIPVVPGFLGQAGDVSEAARAADSIGYPVMIKAVAGGGGRGMRLVEGREGLGESLTRAQSEAKAAFGEGRVFIEKFIPSARHIEVQLLADKHGNVVHLGERECSIQRRHQKLIEETPSPFVDAETRRKLGAQAIALAKAVEYDSAGTAEFIAGEDKSFYFLEMNTRLQVEHPVTELCTGIDLVEQMIRSAAGEKLSIAQHDVQQKGWAIESRILAEDPERNFLPSTGRLWSFREPAERMAGSATLRIDSGVCEGSEISIHYDPLIAKLVTHATDRAAAVDAQSEALDLFVIEGVASNIGFLAAVMVNPRFRRGELSTSFIEQEFPRGFIPIVPEGEIARRLVCVVAAADHVIDVRKRAILGQMRTARLASSRSVMLGKTRYDIQIEEADDGIAVYFETDSWVYRCVSAWAPGRPVWVGTINADRVAVQIRAILNGYRLAHRGVHSDAHVLTPREADLGALMPEKKAASGTNVLRSPMPALVKSVEVTTGQAVKSGEVLCVIEAMKMETVLRAGHDVTVRTISVKPGEFIAVDAVIMAFG
jgi:propionyl-CoA carboxylase alpha chain